MYVKFDPQLNSHVFFVSRCGGSNGAKMCFAKIFYRWIDVGCMVCPLRPSIFAVSSLS